MHRRLQMFERLEMMLRSITNNADCAEKEIKMTFRQMQENLFIMFSQDIEDNCTQYIKTVNSLPPWLFTYMQTQKNHLLSMCNCYNKQSSRTGRPISADHPCQGC